MIPAAVLAPEAAQVVATGLAVPLMDQWRTQCLSSSRRRSDEHRDAAGAAAGIAHVAVTLGFVDTRGQLEALVRTVVDEVPVVCGPDWLRSAALLLAVRLGERYIEVHHP